MAVLTVQGLRRLAGYHQRPVNLEAARKNPYQHKTIRKVIDSLAFGIYGHWVKKGEGQNRAALFENSQKVELKQARESMSNAEMNMNLSDVDFAFHLGSISVKRGRKTADQVKNEQQEKSEDQEPNPAIKVDWY